MDEVKILSYVCRKCRKHHVIYRAEDKPGVALPLISGFFCPCGEIFSLTGAQYRGHTESRTP